MSQGVNRLKELLFEPETQRLSEVQHQLDALAERDKELGKRLEAVFERAGSEERLQKSVTGVIDGVLRDAEKAKHQKMTQAVAPLVVRTIKTELKNSQEEMVDALYPITGRLVKQYVQAAVADMMAEINRKLGGGQKLSDLEAQAKAKGVTVAELVLAETQALKVDELFLIRRGSGDLVAHWEQSPDGAMRNTHPGNAPPGNNRDALIAGYLSGITSFAEEAFDEKKGVLRALDLNGERIFVRASPAYLLAARCSGSAPIAVEQIIDDEFVRVLTAYKQSLDQPAVRNAAGQLPNTVETLLPELATSFEKRFEAKRHELEARATQAPPKPSFARLYVLLTALLLPIATWAAWSLYETAQTVRTKQAVQAILGSTNELNGYPIAIDVERGGQSFRLTGLAPSTAVKDRLVQRLEADVPWARGRNDIVALPQGGRDPTPDLAALRQDIETTRAEVLRRRLDRAGDSLARLQQDVGGLAQRFAARVPPVPERGPTEQVIADLNTAETALAAAKKHPDVATLRTLRGEVAKAEARLGEIAALPARPTPSTSTDPSVIADDVVSTMDRLSAQVPLIERTLAVAPLQKQVADLVARLNTLTPTTQTPRQKLVEWTRSHAVFFLNGTEIANEPSVSRQLDELAQLLSQSRDNMRIVGFTDERTAATVNNLALAASRADRIAQMLIDRGVPRDRLTSVGRPNGNEISRSTGPGTANRRVEFEVGFVDEPR